MADSPPAKELYQYQPLQDGSHIRLIKVTSHSTTRPEPVVEVQLEEYALRQALPYKALSYTWGASERPEQIIIGQDSRLNVTKNLFAFLVYLSKEKPEVFWVDAICINQDDVKERGSQLRLMKQIYQQAREVVVWLYQPNISPLANTSTWNIVENDKDRLLVKLPLWSLRMFHHPWFMRVWHGDKRIHYITWDEARDLGGAYLDRCKHDDRNTPVEEGVELSIAMMVSMDDWKGKAENRIFKLTLSELLSNTRFCGASDPKDKVFALLSLASDVDLNTFDIDYGMSWRDMSECPSPLGKQMLYHPGCPTCPARHLAPIYPYDWPDRGNVASEASRDVTLTCNERLLVAKCLKLLEVVTIAPARMKADYLERYRDMLAVLQQWYQIVREHSIYAHDQKKRISSFCGTLKMTLGSREFEHIEKVYSAGIGWQWHFRKLLGEDVSFIEPEDPDRPEHDLDDATVLSPDNPHLYTPWARELMFGELDHLHGRSFGFASNGQMTLLPPGAREGDHVCLLYGIRLPFLLRQDVDGYFQVIGACYFHQHFNWDVFESRGSWEQLQLITLR